MSPIGKPLKDASAKYGQPKTYTPPPKPKTNQIEYDIVDHNLYITFPDTGRIVRVKKEHAIAFAHHILGSI